MFRSKIKFIHVNHYRSKTIWDIGDVLGQVLEIAFDDTITQSQQYVRVKVMFDVARPLRKSKLINLPHGEQANVEFFYEKNHVRD